MLMRFLVPSLVVFGAALTACDTNRPTAPRSVREHAPISSLADITPTASQNVLLAEIRVGTARYHRVEAALADGYIPASPCEAIPGHGIGIHYRKPSLVDVVVNPSQPELLVYEPRKNGDLQLVAVAFLVPAAAWDPTHNSPPTLGDQVFEDKRVPDWSSPPFPTYELHVWAWKHNPDGMYATTNPLASCEFAP